MKYLKIKHAMGGSRISKTKIILGALQWGIGVELTDDKNGTLWRLLRLMDGSRTRVEIATAMTCEYPLTSTAKA